MDTFASEERSTELEEVSRVPLVVGVSGHVDLQDPEATRSAVKEVLEKLSSSYPSTPIYVMTALAEGADRLAAHVALELGLRILCPLPMKKELYMADFGPGGDTQPSESQKEFLDLLNKSFYSYEVPLPKDVTSAQVAVKDSGERNRQYAALGAFIVRNCQVLIAMWDGVKTDKVGGTSDVVSFQLHGIPEGLGVDLSDLSALESGPVIHILTARVGQPPQKPSTTWHYHRADYNAAEEYFRLTTGHLDDYNKAVLDNFENIKPGLTRVKEEMIGTAAEELSQDEKNLLHRFVVADALALRYRDLESREVSWFMHVGLIAGGLFAFAAHLFHSMLLLAAYIVTLAIIYRRHKAVIRQDTKNKYLDFRALAEGLRVQFYWRVADIKDSVADFYLRKQRSEIDWIRHSLRASSILFEDRERKPRYGIALDRWLVGQRNFFERASGMRVIEAKKLHSVRAALIKTAVALSCLLVLCYGVTIALTEKAPVSSWLQRIAFDSSRNLGSERTWPFEVLITGIALCFIYLASREWQSKVNADSEISKQYASMRDMYVLASERLGKALDEQNLIKARNLVLETGREALNENGDWVLLHRERQIEPPIT